MFDKVAVVGDAELVFAFRALGIQVFSPIDSDEAKQVMSVIEKEKYALCFLHQSFFEPLQEELADLGKKFCPVVVGFSDYREVVDHLGKVMSKMAVKATGSDSLVKRRGNDEKR